MQGRTQGKPVVLLVDDEPAVLGFMRMVLDRSGYAVLSACNGHEALEAARRYPGEIDLLVTDFQMPGIKGLELYEAIIRERPGIRVLFVSGAPAELRAAWPSPPLLEKPFGPSLLVSRVESLLAA